MATIRPALAWTLMWCSLAVVGTGCQKQQTPASSSGDCPSACAQGEVCRAGQCFPAQCETERCGALEVCLNGSCAPAACVAVLCPGDQLCAAGQCLPRRCGADFCKSTEVCRDGACVDARCVGVQCGADEICASGRCYSPSCGGTACGTGEVCEAGSCVNLACAGVVCPQGLRCVSGVCSSVCPTGQEWNGTECAAKQGAPVPQSLRVSPATVSITKGTSQQLKAELVWTDGSVTDVTSTATWTQGTECYFVDHGLVTATGYETCTEALVLHSDGFDGLAQVTVGPAVVTGLQLSDPTAAGTTSFNWRVGDLHQLVARYVWSDLTTSNANVSGITWSSSDPSIVSLDPDPTNVNARLAHPKKIGTVTLSIALGAQSASATVTVNGFAPLMLTKVTPTVGYPGSVISIFGGGFDPTASANVVKIGTHPATVVSVSPQQMVVQLPSTAGFGALTLSTDGGSVTSSERVMVGLPDASYLSPPSPVTDSIGAPARVLTDGFLISDNGYEAYYQQERTNWFSTGVLTFDLGNAQQPLEHVAVRVFDSANGCALGFSAMYPPTTVGVSVADSLSALDAGTSTYTGYFSTNNPPSCGGMRAVVVATPGATGRYVQVTVVPNSASQTIIDEIFFSPE